MKILELDGEIMAGSKEYIEFVLEQCSAFQGQGPIKKTGTCTSIDR